MSNEQTHPLHATDKKIIDSLISKEIPEDFDWINLARLINRYDNFPGEIEIKDDIEKKLKFWNITKDNLFLKTKKLWSNNFRPSNMNIDLVGSSFDTSNWATIHKFTKDKCLSLKQILKFWTNY